MPVSVLTLNKNRSSHLENLIKGLERNPNFQGELIIAQMDKEYQQLKSAFFPIYHIPLPSEQLVLAKARNQSAEFAHYDKLIFLDVDCIPGRDFIISLSQSLNRYHAIFSPKVLYLPDLPLPNHWQESHLQHLGREHSARHFPQKGLAEEKNPGLFWSLAFAISKSLFEKIGGFCEDYIGYGAEDTDFSYKAQSLGIKHFLMSDAIAYHQYHLTFDPPWQHFVDIIKNAQIFYQKWHIWPMHGWLKRFEQEGLISWKEKHIDILALPHKKLMQNYA